MIGLAPSASGDVTEGYAGDWSIDHPARARAAHPRPDRFADAIARTTLRSQVQILLPQQRCLKPGSLGAWLFACRQRQHFRQLALEVDAQFIAIGHEADLVDEPTNYLTGFLPRSSALSASVRLSTFFR